MRAQSAYFFATGNDLEPGLQAVERKVALKYVLSGLFPSPATESIASALEIPDLGTAKYGDQIQESRYLVIDQATETKARAVPQRRGGVLYAVDHVANPTAVIFSPGGLFEQRCLISGEVTGLGDPRSLALHRIFVPLVLAGFEKIKSFRVGPEAARFLDTGMRLTQGVRSPAECDLRRDDTRKKKSGAITTSIRRSLEATWQYLREQAIEPPEDQYHRPFVPERMPSHDDTLLGLSFFRTGLEDDELGNLTLPRTYFGRSQFRKVSFHNTDLRESRMCWNDWLECDFIEADLSASDMRASFFRECRFTRAILDHADMRWATFEECDFSGARMIGAKLTYQQATGLVLTSVQRDEIDWQAENGPEPPGG